MSDVMNLDLVYNGKVRSRLNKMLVDSRGLTEEDVDRLKWLNTALWDLEATIIDKESLTKEEALEYALSVQDIEFSMQNAWGFDENANMHSRWYDDQNCSCPKLDNQDALGSSLKYYSFECKIHGDLLDEKAI